MDSIESRSWSANRPPVVKKEGQEAHTDRSPSEMEQERSWFSKCLEQER